MDTMSTLKKFEDQYFTMVKTVQAPVTRYAGQVAERVAEYVPARPAFLAPLPTVGEVVDYAITLRNRVVKEQAAFVQSMLKATSPVVAKFEADVKPAAKATKVATARKAA